jgi:phage terminase large subunit GpA-like protein
MTEPKIPAPPAARLIWALYVDCPKCGEENDLSEGTHDPEFDIARHIFSDDWDKLRGWEVECEHCAHEFTIEKVEY